MSCLFLKVFAATSLYKKREDLLADLQHQRGEIISPSGVQRFFHQSLRRRQVGQIGRRMANEFFNAAVPNPIGNAVGAKNEEVSNVEGLGCDLRFHSPLASDGSFQLTAIRMVSGFSLRDFPRPKQSAGNGVVFGQLPQLSVFGEMVDSAVADVNDVGLFFLQPTQAEGGAHSFAFVIELRHVSGSFVDALAKVVEQFFGNLTSFLSFLMKFSGDEFNHGFQNDFAGKFAGLLAAHAVADRKNKFVLLHLRLPFVAEEGHFLAVEHQSEKGVFVVSAHAALMRLRGPGNLERCGGVCGVHDLLSSSSFLRDSSSSMVNPSPVSKMVANSKSIMQNLPSRPL